MAAYNVTLIVTDANNCDLFIGPVNWPSTVPVPRVGETINLGADLNEFHVTDIVHMLLANESCVGVCCFTEIRNFTSEEISGMIRESGLWKEKT